MNKFEFQDEPDEPIYKSTSNSMLRSLATVIELQNSSIKYVTTLPVD